MYRDLTRGSISRSLLLFALPMIAGNLLQQFYNIADTLIVGRALGSEALAAVGSAYTLMTFLTSIFLGLSMGSGALFSIYRGRGDESSLRLGFVHAFGLILCVTLMLNAAVYLFLEPILRFLQVPESVAHGMQEYLLIIFAGLLATSLYNYLSCLLRALGNSTVPLVFLAVSAMLNIGLDLLFVLVFHWGIAGAAWATVIAQYMSGVGILWFFLAKCKHLLPKKKELHYDRAILKDIFQLSSLTCVQQSVMNFGILMVQGLVNSFGATVMAAFAAAVKIDTFAYLPVQDFGNVFCAVISALVVGFAEPLMGLFVNASETAVVATGAHYLRIEGACYFGIGWLFLLYGYYRAVQKPLMSVILTVISLGTRVALAYVLSGVMGVTGIWLAIPIGWALADIAGFAGLWRRGSDMKNA